MMKIDNSGKCTRCGIPPSHPTHTQEYHTFNTLLFEYNEFRNTFVRNRDGIEISQVIKTKGITEAEQEYDIDNGTFIVKVTTEKLFQLGDTIEFEFVIKNIRNADNIYMVFCDLLYPSELYTITDDNNIIASKKYLELSPGERYTIHVYFKPKTVNVSEYLNHIAFKFQDLSKNQYTFYRTLLVKVRDHNVAVTSDDSTHFKGKYWSDIIEIVPATSEQASADEYPIPSEYVMPVLAGLQFVDNFTNRDRRIITQLNKILDCKDEQTGEDISNLSYQNYAKFFHLLLWLDEACQVLSLRQYNLSDVTMSLVLDDILELQVEGLAEKRPSLLPNDSVYTRLYNDHTAYEGIIKTVNDTSIWIHNINSIVVESISLNSNTEFDVAFKLSRLKFERKHKGVDMCVKKNLETTLFPPASLRDRRVANRYRSGDLTFFNQNVFDNMEQRIAVLSILNETAFPAPYIVFGPPGTGKTITIVEAILQLKKHKPKSKILICAPSNAACDMLTEKLTEHKRCNKTELLRIHAESRNWSDVPACVRPFSNHDGIHYTKVDGYQLHNYRIIITTLVLIGRYPTQYTPDYVFIDEAAQAPEPEADIAIAMVATPKVVLAGDPKQLGPVCQSKVAEKKHLSLSILERLMNRELYVEDNTFEYISRLRLNYRANPSVLHVPNQLFYGGELQPINKKAESDPIATLCIAHFLSNGLKTAVKGFPVEFYSVIAQEQRQGKSPSYFNTAEIEIVIKHVVALMKQKHVRVQQEDIGIISPYIRQVHRLKEELAKRNLTNIEIGTTEAYQGREKRILIITTVRGHNDLLLYDKKYDLGFLENAKRMNVALTRAMSKLIIVGNPTVLSANTDACENWRYLIRFCKNNNSFFGTPYEMRDAVVRKEISLRIITLVGVQDRNVAVTSDDSTHFKGKYWFDIIEIVPATSEQASADEYPIPSEYVMPVLAGLQFVDNFTNRDRRIITQLNKILDCKDEQTGEDISNLSYQNYAKFFHSLLWLDEACQVLSLRQYNLSDVTMSLVLDDILELQVEGLAEKRPSLLPNDSVYTRLYNDHTVYEGIIKTVNDTSIWIHNINSIVVESISLNSNTEFDVAFKLSKLKFERKHKGVDMCVKKNLETTLFPPASLRDRRVANRYGSGDLTFFNQNVFDNMEQRIAVLSILNETAFPAPYIVFGPPGTGKTITIVEAILQLKKHKPKSKILICAPSNAACDMLTEKLTEHKRCNKTELLRIHAESRNWSDVPACVRPFSNHDGIHYTKVDGYQLHNYRIIITTLVLIGRYPTQYTPDYVFIDEAAQAPEPEADIVIAMVATPKVVLAGDPKQLGPVCQSKVAEKKHLSLSILERLMNRELYVEDNTFEYISRLRLNYRANPSVLHVPNQLFYGGELQPINKKAENDPIATLCIAHFLSNGLKTAVKGFPVEFYSVIAQEQRQGKSPSYFNTAEIEIVIKHVVALMKQKHVRVQQEDIGIISPYIRQVHRLKEELAKRNLTNIEIGTTEAYQGREKRILIITTVRGHNDLLLYDKKYDLGFLENAKCMNVALTRAMSKLIIVGNPTVLSANTDACENWRYLIRFCKNNNSFFGTPYEMRDAVVRKEISLRIITVTNNQNPSHKKNTEQNDPQ